MAILYSVQKVMGGVELVEEWFSWLEGSCQGSMEEIAADLRPGADKGTVGGVWAELGDVLEIKKGSLSHMVDVAQNYVGGQF